MFLLETLNKQPTTQRQMDFHLITTILKERREEKREHLKRSETYNVVSMSVSVNYSNQSIQARSRSLEE